MDKNKLIEAKKKLLALGLVGMMLGATGCTSLDENGVPTRIKIGSSYSNVEDYYKYAIQDGKAVKLYNSSNIYLLFNKETYEVSEFIYRDYVTWFGGVELYDLESEEMLVYGDGINTEFNEDYYNYILKNNYQVCLNEISDYVEGHDSKEYYSLDEIRELEPQIAKSLKIINKAKVKTK